MTHTEHAEGGPERVAPEDLPHLRRCVELAAEAVDARDFPFGSVLKADGRVLAEDRNRENTMDDPTRHPEFELARWAAANMTAAGLGLPPPSSPRGSTARCARPRTPGWGSAASCT